MYIHTDEKVFTLQQNTVSVLIGFETKVWL